MSIVTLEPGKYLINTKRARFRLFFAGFNLIDARYGGPWEVRTPYLRYAKPALYQLS